MIEFTSTQQDALSVDGSVFLLGAVGTGKTAVLHHHILTLLQRGEPAYTILTLVAEAGHRDGFLHYIHNANAGPYTDLNITTYNQMAQEMVVLFWPLLARDAGFSDPHRPPTLLSYDLAQLLMWQIVTPLLAEGAFVGLRLRPQQIVSQLLDTLNRAALNGLTMQEAIARQQNSWVGEADRVRHLQDAETAVSQFRTHCLQNSLLDLSLIIQTFDRHLVKHPDFSRYFSERYRHLLVDNVEEQTPAGQNLIHQLMGSMATAAIAYDAGGGYKRFMAADPTGANRFRTRCDYAFGFNMSFVTPAPLWALSNLVENELMKTQLPTEGADEAVLAVVNGRYRRDMVMELLPTLTHLIAQGTPPSEIAIITPYLDGALRYNLTQELQAAGLPYFLLRRRSSPRDEPRIRTWLTWLAIAHPEWQMPPSAFDVAEAIALSIDGLDPARAALLTRHWYDGAMGSLRPITALAADVQERVGAEWLPLLSALQEWLLAANELSLSRFLHDLFTELLSQPRFHPEPDLAAAAVCDWLVRAAARLESTADGLGLHDRTAIGQTFIDSIYQGIVTSNPPHLGNPPDPDGIMISTIYGYLLAGKPVQVQVWLDAAATGWWDIPNQPLSNAFVLAQSWPDGKIWTTDDDFNIRNQLLSRLVRGLNGRCSNSIILANSDFDRRGLRQDGALWKIVSPLIQTATN